MTDRTHTEHDFLSLIAEITRRLELFSATQQPGDYPTQELALLKQEQKSLLESFYQRLLEIGETRA